MFERLKELFGIARNVVAEPQTQAAPAGNLQREIERLHGLEQFEFLAREEAGL